MKRVLLALALVLAAVSPAPASAAVGQTAPSVTGPQMSDDAREVLRLRCEKLIAERRMESQELLNVGFGAVLGAGLGALLGSFMGFTAWGAGLGTIYGGVVGHLSGEQASTALEQRMMEYCMRGGLR